MTKSSSVFTAVPGSYAIIVVRVIILCLSIAGLVLYALTLSIYNDHVAPIGALAPPKGSSILNVNIVSIVATVLSIIWSIIHLGFLAHRLLEIKSRGRRRNSNGGEEWSGSGKPVIHPRWIVLVDTICWVWFVVMAVLTGIEAGRWKDGRNFTIYGSPGTTDVNLKACPTYESGKIDYWCLSDWRKFVDLSQDGTSILGTLAGVHSNRVGVAAYEWYLLHRYHRLSGGWWCRSATSTEPTTDNAGSYHHTKDIELEHT